MGLVSVSRFGLVSGCGFGAVRCSPTLCSLAAYTLADLASTIFFLSGAFVPLWLGALVSYVYLRVGAANGKVVLCFLHCGDFAVVGDPLVARIGRLLGAVILVKERDGQV